MTDSSLSIIIPALGAAPGLPATLRALEEGSGLTREVLVVGGAADEPFAQRLAGDRVRLLAAGAPGRGRQLAAGAEAAKGPWLLFLHADTALARGWSQAVGRFINENGSDRRAAYFRLVLDDDSAQARRVEQLANWRCRRLSLPYGDQGLLIHRSLYEDVGGYRAYPLMEDVDLVRRLGAKRLIAFDGAAVTSAERYRRDGWWARPARNLCLLSLYFLGLPPAWLRRLYG
ncbi:MAG: TIGR04283 family arsenosugar biosynthesis glycosyltransferase [Pseudomonadota bacterium]